MVLEKLRGKSDRILETIAKPFSSISPNTMSFLAFLFACVAGVLFYFNHLILGGILVLLNGLFDALDGVLARINGLESKLGDLIDHTLDRIADVAIILGLTLSDYLFDPLGYTGAIIILLVSYMGTQAQALGVGRVYTGVVGRADRILLIGIISIVQGIISGFRIIGSFTIIDVLFVYFLVAGLVTFIQRFIIAYKALKKLGGKILNQTK